MICLISLDEISLIDHIENTHVAGFVFQDKQGYKKYVKVFK